MKRLLIIGGATGSGKSGVAVQVAHLLGGEVVSADSMQIYRGLNVGTAKITKEETEGIPHYMIDVCSPKDVFSVCDYKKHAIPIIEDIFSRGKVPVVCGGTGLYVHSLIYDMSYSGEYDEELRRKLKAELDAFGKDHMFESLRSIDPRAAEKLHVNDEKRVLRAIEKAMTGGREENDFEKPLYDHKIYLMTRDRGVLYERINARVDQMFRDGLKKEISELIASGVDFSDRCMQAIAYKEWKEFFSGQITEEDVRELIKKRTRNYAKRQITWFKQYKEARLIEADGKSAQTIAEEIVCDFRKKD